MPSPSWAFTVSSRRSSKVMAAVPRRWDEQVATPLFANTGRNEQFGDGKLQHMDCYECLNPLESFWSQWWGDDMPTKAALKARELTRGARLGGRARHLSLDSKPLLWTCAGGARHMSGMGYFSTFSKS